MVDMPAQRHHAFYFPDGTLIFRAQNVLFKVHKRILSDKSVAFKTMFDVNDYTDISPLQQGLGLTDDKPILVPERISDTAFELFLSVCYDKWRPDSSHDGERVVVELLELSRIYEAQDVRKYAIKLLSITDQYTFKPIDLASIALKYQIKDIFCRAFRQLVHWRINDIKDSEFDLLDSPVWRFLFRLRERLDIHRRIVACEPPRLVHSVRCEDHRRCHDDWCQLWWNGMGRFLVDGRNPQSFDHAILQFQGLSYGSMNPECWRKMIKCVKEGKAFVHEDDLVDRAVRGLAEIIIPEPISDYTPFW
ncbi:hypothetical protein EDD15DRAFT_2323847 [Pisolithus albus]|nr:hypothetical protein EDD15DRAFT_2323847 [Pisolithus albus]